MAVHADHQAGWQVFAIGSAFFAVLTAIFGKCGVAEVNSNLATLIRTVIILVMTAGWISIRQEWEPLARLSRYGLSMIVLSGLATGFSWLCYYRALQMSHASQVAAIDKLSVVFAIALAIAFLGEPLNWRIVLGGTLIVLGTMTIAK